MGTVKQINIKNRTYYFYNDIIDLENFKSNLLKIDKKVIEKHCYLQYWIYCLCITHASGYIEEVNGNKYLIIDSTDENKELLNKYNDVFNGIRDEIKTISGGKENDYEKDYMKIRFNSDDNLPVNKPLKIHLMTIIIGSAFKEDGKLYAQVFVDDTLHELST